jgi:hypothetical protein
MFLVSVAMNIIITQVRVHFSLVFLFFERFDEKENSRNIHYIYAQLIISFLLFDRRIKRNKLGTVRNGPFVGKVSSKN